MRNTEGEPLGHPGFRLWALSGHQGQGEGVQAEHDSLPELRQRLGFETTGDCVDMCRLPKPGQAVTVPRPWHADGHLVHSTEEAAQADSTSPSRVAASGLRAEWRYEGWGRAGRWRSGLV